MVDSEYLCNRAKIIAAIGGKTNLNPWLWMGSIWNEERNAVSFALIQKSNLPVHAAVQYTQMLNEAHTYICQTRGKSLKSNS